MSRASPKMLPQSTLFWGILPAMAGAPTPSMQQYLKAKAEHPDCMVLFRMGDFYETFYDDALEAGRLLDIAVTSRNKDAEDPVPMAGVPWHSVSGYIQRLIDAGKRIAICEQMEDPKQAKGLVRRDVVRVITPGVLLDSELTDPTAANHLVCLLRDARGWAAAALDASTGDFFGTFTTSKNDLRLFLDRLVPREILLFEPDDDVRETVPATVTLRTMLAPADLDVSGIPPERAALFSDTGLDSPVMPAAAAILSYVGRTHPALLPTIRLFRQTVAADTMALPNTTIRNLELLSTTSGDSRRGCLFSYLNRTRTGMGARLLRQWMLAPLASTAGIAARLDKVDSLFDNPTERSQIRAALASVPDLERLLTRLAGGNSSARDLKSLAAGIQGMQEAARVIAGSSLAALDEFSTVEPALLEMAFAIERTFVDDAPSTVKDGGMVCRGVSDELDCALDMAEHGRQYIAAYEAEERVRSGISKLRVKYNRVFGYTIEIPNSAAQNVPADFIRRQTLANAERFTTQRLSELEHQVSTAEETSKDLQFRIFEQWRLAVLDMRVHVQALASSASALDVLSNLAEIAHTRGWTRPVVNDGRGIIIVEGRHPIVEASIPEGTFVPNDFVLDGVETNLTIITGPNMSGKSTIMRQVAIIVLLAHMGSRVPADRAEIGITDAIYTRVGAMDDIAAGRSTFMVEMSEAAEMLARATDRSLVILDEIGRGTSTFDGVAIAWAIAEHIQDRIRCRTLFATHYHELTDLVRSIPAARNQSVAVKEWGHDVLFLRKLVDGPASRSYGIQVARLAGLPDDVIARSREVLANLENSELDAVGRPMLARSRRRAPVVAIPQLDLFGGAAEPETDPIVMELAEIDTDNLTPISALTTLAGLVGKARERKLS